MDQKPALHMPVPAVVVTTVVLTAAVEAATVVPAAVVGLSVSVSFDLNSKKDALAFAMHSESFVAQAARLSTKHLNSEEQQTEVQNWVRNSVE